MLYMYPNQGDSSALFPNCLLRYYYGVGKTLAVSKCISQGNCAYNGSLINVAYYAQVNKREMRRILVFRLFKVP